VGKYLEAPSVAAEEASVLVRVGDTAQLKCSAVGYPTPVIGWSRNEEEIVTNSKYEVSIQKLFKASFIHFGCQSITYA
jgi:hypothetical protein